MTLKSGEVYFSEQGSSISFPETISLFGFSISFYGFFLVLAALVGIFVVVKETGKKHQDVEWNLTLITVTIVSAVLGARLFFVVFHWQMIVEEPVAVLNVRSGGLSYYGALFGAWFAVKWYCRRKRKEYLQSADSLAMGAAAAAPFVWLGCAMIKEPIGRFYDGVFSIRIGTGYIPDGIRTESIDGLMARAGRVGNASYLSMHPVALYGVVFTAVVFAVLLILKRFLPQDGGVFTYYLLMNAVVSIVLEQFRAEHACIWGTGIPVNYVVAGVLIFAIVLERLKQVWRQRGSRIKHL